MNEKGIVVADKLYDIRAWLEGMFEENNNERLSYGELAQIDAVYDIIKKED